jgi:hypothetical protein
MKCPSCGKETLEQSIYCQHCGSLLAKPSSSITGKFEYSWLYVSPTWSIKFRDGTSFKNVEDVFNWLNKMGAQGWELVSAAPDHNGTLRGDRLFILKRRIA